MRMWMWAVAGVALLLVVALFALPRGQHRPQHTPQADVPAEERARNQPARSVAATSPSASPAPAVQPPDPSAIIGSCLRQREGSQECTDYMGTTPEQTAHLRATCLEGGHKFNEAMWSDAPCDHASSNGGCWTSTKRPPQVRWFYGTLHPNFRPGPDTHHVCGAKSVGFTREGIPVKHDGTPETNFKPWVVDADAGGAADPGSP